ncbi:MAG: rubrerythrin family protein [Haloarculaceae archaeon]
MNPEEFIDAVREENQTALSRLGSSKSLYADTMGEMDTDTVLEAAAEAEFAAAETFGAWAEAESGEAGEAFAATAAEEESHYETVVGHLDDFDAADAEVPAIQAYLRDLDGVVERAGGLVGRTLAAEKSKEQLTGFFVGQAKPRVADEIRDMSADLDAQLDRAVDLLAAVCEDEDDWEAALGAAGGAIQAAYDEYTERLESMGVNPKPVC